MPASPPLARPRLHATIVSESRETLDGLEAYLQRAGVTTSTTRQIERSAEVARDSSAIVMFPDDFDWDAVITALAECGRVNAYALPVLVTRRPKRFESLVRPNDAPTPVVVPKPAWGWTILDAIRAHPRESARPNERALIRR